MAVTQPQELRISIYVRHLLEWQECGREVPIAGALIDVWIKKSGRDIFTPVTQMTTNDKGLASRGIGIYPHEWPVVMLFEITKKDFKKLRVEEPVSGPGTLSKIYELDPVEGTWSGCGDRQSEWELTPWPRRLALSFIVALVILESFKVMQGFSMERWNPVA